VLSRRAVNALIQMKERSRYLRTLSQHVGYENRSYEYDLIQRRTKPRTKNLVEAVELAVNIIVANTLRPLHMVSWLALAVAALNAGYLVYIVVIYLFKQNVVEGWITLSLQDAVMFLFLFLILAVLCEYVGRIFDESKGRPLYYVMEEKTSSVILLDDQKKNVVTESTED
jgi:dolichol-phosphate mannosyltransferase